MRNSRNATAEAEPRFHHLKPSSYMKYSTLTVLCSGPPWAGHRQDAHQQQGRTQHRQRDAAELLPQARAVEARRLVQVGGNALQRGQKDDHVVAEVLPHREQDDRRQRPMRIPQPVDRLNAEVSERVVEQSVACVQQVAPHDRHGYERRHHGYEKRRAKEPGQVCKP